MSAAGGLKIQRDEISRLERVHTDSINLLRHVPCGFSDPACTTPNAAIAVNSHNTTNLNRSSVNSKFSAGSRPVFALSALAKPPG
jgi:hypothetical protein